jgi:hypothetical protein
MHSHDILFPGTFAYIMKKYLSPLFVLVNACLLSACHFVTEQTYFDRAVLNVMNMSNGFSGDGLLSELESPSVRLVEGSDNKTVAIKRKEVIDAKIQFLEENLRSIKELEETPDTKDILQTSRALNEYVLPVYKNEYRQLAKLYDEGAPKEQIQALAQKIHNTYYTGYDNLCKRLVSYGKPYAEQNHIRVNWGNL